MQILIRQLISQLLIDLNSAKHFHFHAFTLQMRLKHYNSNRKATQTNPDNSELVQHFSIHGRINNKLKYTNVK